MSDPLELRPAVRAFAEAMERKLRANDDKRPWRELPFGLLLFRLMEECAELSGAVYFKADPEAIEAEAADVANFAMMIADNAMRRVEHDGRGRKPSATGEEG